MDCINTAFCTLIILIASADCEGIISHYVTDTVFSTDEDSSVEVTENIFTYNHFLSQNMLNYKVETTQYSIAEKYNPCYCFQIIIIALFVLYTQSVG